MKMVHTLKFIYWNRNVDRLIRVLQRMETFSICPKQE